MNPHPITILAAAFLSGCYSSSSVREQAAVRIEIASALPFAAVADCIQEAWSRDVAALSSPFQGGRNIRVVIEDIVIMAQADIVPNGAGSTVVFTTPYAAQVKNYEPAARSCATVASTG